jgi:hypothetical protein
LEKRRSNSSDANKLTRTAIMPLSAHDANLWSTCGICEGRGFPMIYIDATRVNFGELPVREGAISRAATPQDVEVALAACDTSIIAGQAMMCG